MFVCACLFASFENVTMFSFCINTTAANDG